MACGGGSTEPLLSSVFDGIVVVAAPLLVWRTAIKKQDIAQGIGIEPGRYFSRNKIVLGLL